MKYICKLKKYEDERVVKSPCEYQSVNNDILEGRFAKQCCGEHQQGVEPAEGYKKGCTRSG